MKKLIFLGLVAALVLFLSDSYAQPSDVNGEQQLVKLLSNFNTMTAKFDQKIYDGQGVVLDQSSGEMSLKRPGFFRWQIDKPTKQVLYAHDDILWIYHVDLEQATKQKISNNVGVSPAQLLMGSTQSLSQEFNIVTQDGGRFRLTPKQSSDVFDWVELQFADGKLSSMRMADNLGQVTALVFSQVKINQPINNSVFEFKPPKGIDIINQVS